MKRDFTNDYQIRWRELDDEEISIAITAAFYYNNEDISYNIDYVWRDATVIYDASRRALDYYWVNYDEINKEENKKVIKQLPIINRKNLIQAMEL
jgi:hypothetical protein